MSLCLPQKICSVIWGCINMGFSGAVGELLSGGTAWKQWKRVPSFWVLCSESKTVTEKYWVKSAVEVGWTVVHDVPILFSFNKNDKRQPPLVPTVERPHPKWTEGVSCAVEQRNGHAAKKRPGGRCTKHFTAGLRPVKCFLACTNPIFASRQPITDLQNRVCESLLGVKGASS